MEEQAGKHKPKKQSQPCGTPGQSAVMLVNCLIGGEKICLEIRSKLGKGKGYGSIDGNIWYCVIFVNGLLQSGDVLYYYKEPEAAAMALANRKITQWRKDGRDVEVQRWKVEKDAE